MNPPLPPPIFFQFTNSENLQRFCLFLNHGMSSFNMDTSFQLRDNLFRLLSYKWMVELNMLGVFASFNSNNSFTISRLKKLKGRLKEFKAIQLSSLHTPLSTLSE